MTTKVSINLCCYNSEQYLRETLDSIVNQTYKDWELIVINDGSSDSTESIIFEYVQKGCPICYHYQQNKGLGASRNEALKRSSGEYIAFMDHDDVWLPEKLEKQISDLERNPQVDFHYTNYFCLKGKRKFLAMKGRQPEGLVFERFLYDYRVSVVTVVIRKSALQDRCLQFNENLHVIEDFELFMKVLYKSQAMYLDEPLVVYRIHPEMSSVVLMERRPTEWDQAMEDLKSLAPDFEETYCDVIEYYAAQNALYRAKIELFRNQNLVARKYLAPYKRQSAKAFSVYLITFLPPMCVSMLIALKNKIRPMIMFDN